MKAPRLIPLLVTLALLAPAAANAAPRQLEVDDTADFGLAEHPELCGQGSGPFDHLCTLRAALELAASFDGAASGTERIVVTVTPGHYTLSSHRPLPVGDARPESCVGGEGKKVPCPLTVQGAGQAGTVIDGDGATGLMTIAKGAGPVDISGVALTRARSAGGAIEDDEGGGVTVRHSRLSEAGGGGAIRLHDDSMTLLESVIEGNQAQSGAVVEARGGELQLVRSSVTGNIAGPNGAALSGLEGAHLALLDSTLSQNSLPGGGAVAAGSGATVEAAWSTVDGGGVAALHAAGAQHISLEGSILTGAGALSCDGPVPVAASGANVLHGGISGCVLSGTTPSTDDPLLGAPVSTLGVPALPLLRGSPALNAAGASCPGSTVEGRAQDEHGVPRPLGSACDVGAYESAADAAVALSAKPAVAGSPFALTVTVSAQDVDPLSGAVVRIALPPFADLISAPSGCVASYGEATQLTCPLGSVLAVSRRTLTFQVQPVAVQTLQVQASAHSDQADYEPLDDSASLAVPVGVPGATRPVATLLSRTLRVDRHGNTYVRLRCVAPGAGTPCATSLALYPAHGRIAALPNPSHAGSSARLLASSRTTFGAGRTVTVLVHLSKKARRRIHLRRTAHARLAISTGAAPARTSLALVTLVRR